MNGTPAASSAEPELAIPVRRPAKHCSSPGCGLPGDEVRFRPEWLRPHEDLDVLQAGMVVLDLFVLRPE